MPNEPRQKSLKTIISPRSHIYIVVARAYLWGGAPPFLDSEHSKDIHINIVYYHENLF